MRRLLVLVAGIATLLGAGSVLADTQPSPAASAQVKIDNYTFKPATLTIAAGTTVTWKNLDDDPHTATAADGSFDSKGLAQGDTFSFRFTKPGTYAYHCTVHPFMQGTILVQPTTSDTSAKKGAR